MAEFSDKSATRTKPNYLYSIISVTLVLFLLGFFGMIMLQAQRLITVFQERVNLVVDIEEGTPDTAIDELRKRLEKTPFVKPGTISFVSREEAARQMREEFGEDFLKLDMPNPFHDVMTFNVRAAYMNADSLRAIRAGLLEHEIVNDFFYQESLVGEIAGNLRRIGYVALGVGLFFILVAVALIHNTIRLALYANRFLIKNMELVGASWEFISRPYLWRAAGHGALSGLLAAAALTGLLLWARRDLPELHEVQDPGSLGLLLGGLFVLGILITTMSTFNVVNKYLKMRVDDLY